MSASQHTTNYNLPIFVASDTPKFLTDFNGAMNKIDSAIKTVDDKTADGTEALETAETANNNATQAKSTAESANTLAQKNNNILASFFEGFTNFENWSPSD